MSLGRASRNALRLASPSPGRMRGLRSLRPSLSCVYGVSLAACPESDCAPLTPRWRGSAGSRSCQLGQPGGLGSRTPSPSYPAATAAATYSSGPVAGSVVGAKVILFIVVYLPVAPNLTPLACCGETSSPRALISGRPSPSVRVLIVVLDISSLVREVFLRGVSSSRVCFSL